MTGLIAPKPLQAQCAAAMRGAALAILAAGPAAAQSVPGYTGKSAAAYHLAFDDEFNACAGQPSPCAVDATKWETGWFASTGFTVPVNGLEDNCYDTSLPKVDPGGFLDLGLSLNSNPACKRRDGTQAPYRGSIVNSRNDFTFAYGIVEWRAQLPATTTGLLKNWPALWSDGTGTWPTTGEIDTMERLSGANPCYHYHYSGGDPGGCAPLASNAGYHLFAADWEPGRVRAFYDGNLVWTWTTGVVSAQHFLIMGHQINTDWPPVGTGRIKVDYARVWQAN